MTVRRAGLFALAVVAGVGVGLLGGVAAVGIGLVAIGAFLVGLAFEDLTAFADSSARAAAIFGVLTVALGLALLVGVA